MAAGPCARQEGSVDLRRELDASYGEPNSAARLRAPGPLVRADVIGPGRSCPWLLGGGDPPVTRARACGQVVEPVAVDPVRLAVKRGRVVAVECVGGGQQC